MSWRDPYQQSGGASDDAYSDPYSRYPISSDSTSHENSNLPRFGAAPAQSRHGFNLLADVATSEFATGSSSSHQTQRHHGLDQYELPGRYVDRSTEPQLSFGRPVSASYLSPYDAVHDAVSRGYTGDNALSPSDSSSSSDSSRSRHSLAPSQSIGDFRWVTSAPVGAAGFTFGRVAQPSLPTLSESERYAGSRSLARTSSIDSTDGLVEQTSSTFNLNERHATDPWQQGGAEKSSRPPSPTFRKVSGYSKQPSICEICGKGFTMQLSFIASGQRRKLTLERDGSHNKEFHQKTCHFDVKKHACDICDKSFARRNDLDRHRRGHTGEKPYVCTRCDAQFARSDALVRHQRGACSQTQAEGAASLFGFASPAGSSGSSSSSSSSRYLGRSFCQSPETDWVSNAALTSSGY